MPNWAYSQYRAVGNSEQLRKLYAIMKELENIPEPGIHESDFGSSWLGNLVIKLGGKHEDIFCRGSWCNLCAEEEYLTFDVESAWGELRETRKFIEKQFPGIKLYFQCEEPGNCVFETNDALGKYFTERYYLGIENDESLYFNTLEGLIKVVEEITGNNELTSVESCKAALAHYSTSHNNRKYVLEQFAIVD